jgi:glucose/arabinose dehydrogenase
MKAGRRRTLALGSVVLLAGCVQHATLDVSEGIGPTPVLPEPRHSLIPTVHIASAVHWPAGDKPVAARGLAVGPFATGLDHPRWLYVLPNGDVLVAETNGPPRPEDTPGIKGWFFRHFQKKAGAGVPSADRITLLRDTNGDGVADRRYAFLTNLTSPFGMVLVGHDLIVANTDALVRFRYADGDTVITAPGTRITSLPAGPINHHWTKNVVASPDGATLYVTVGSNSNVAERGMAVEAERAAVWAVDAARGTHRLYAEGLRNPVGMAWEPATGALWVAVNERDELGSDLVPDYMTAVRPGAFYGWPYSYYGGHVDERVSPQKPALVARAIAPDYALGAHTASLGLAWSGGGSLPATFQKGMFVGQHGSWNRAPHSGYKVIFVPFANGRPSGAPMDVLTGFLTEDGDAKGRPVGVAIDRRGALLVADDVGNTVWRVRSAP